MQACSPGVSDGSPTSGPLAVATLAGTVVVEDTRTLVVDEQAVSTVPATTNAPKTAVTPRGPPCVTVPPYLIGSIAGRDGNRLRVPETSSAGFKQPLRTRV